MACGLGRRRNDGNFVSIEAFLKLPVADGVIWAIGSPLIRPSLRGSEALETIRKGVTVAFDKIGTLTTGQSDGPGAAGQSVPGSPACAASRQRP